ncbi:MAG: dockerin type I repeat-containing protein, partial [Bacteroidaceae bacterium]|nr:dockerin type I repeat-containing protein [Bacteroidaceae bacterium]
YAFADDIEVEILFDYGDFKTPVYSNRSTDTDGRNVLMVMLDCPAAVVKGDVDGNGVVNSADVVAIYNFILSGEAETGISKAAADVDGNGEVNSADVVAVYNIIIGE